MALPAIRMAQEVKGVVLENDEAGSFGGAGALGPRRSAGHYNGRKIAYRDSPFTWPTTFGRALRANLRRKRRGVEGGFVGEG